MFTSRSRDRYGEPPFTRAARVAAPERSIGSRRLNLHELLFAAKYSLSMVIACLAVAAITTFAGTFLVTKIYTTTVFVAPITEESEGGSLGGIAKQFGGLAGLAGGGGSNTGGKADRNLAILKSRAFTETFLRASNFGAAVQARRSLLAQIGFARHKYSGDDLFRLFDRDVRQVTVDAHTGFATITIQWSDPQLAADWANTLVAAANEKIRQQAIREADLTLKFLNDEMATAQIIELRQAISSLMAAQMKSKMLATVRPGYAFSVIDPAVAPPEDRYTKPNRPLLVAAGAFAGLLIGLLFAVRRWRAAGRPGSVPEDAKRAQ
jgi:uncharacterized protein involved in exopolysaccharide biosynthesis